MSLMFVDGFDHYQDLLAKWDAFQPENTGTAGSFIGILPAIGRGGGGALKFLAVSNLGAIWAFKHLASNQVTLFIGFAVNITYGNATISSQLLSVLDGATEQVSLWMTSAGKFFFQRGGGLAGGGTNIGSTSTAGITFNSWHYLEVQITINSSTGVASLHIDGVSALNQTGLNTNNSGVAQINMIMAGIIGSSNGYGTGITVLFDDLYVLNTSGSVNNTYLGNTQIKGLLPTGNGSTLNYAQNEAVWVANTETYKGHRIKDSNGNIQEVTTVTSDAKTGGSAPTWATGVGLTTLDNHVTWTCRGASAQWLDVNENPPEGSTAWQQNTAYALGTAIWDYNKNIQLCTTAGTSGLTSPGTNATVNPWSQTPGGTTVDNTVTWTCLGPGESLYLSDGTVGDISRFTFPAIATASVQAVVCTIRARKSDSNARSVRGDTKSGATVADSGTDLPLLLSYSHLQGFFETDPNTGVPWTQAGVNAAEFGVKTTV